MRVPSLACKRSTAVLFTVVAPNVATPCEVVTGVLTTPPETSAVHVAFE